ncbi:MAG: hypothetical protein PHS53_04880 [Candidatus Pacebacteria bacterium]|nr:hypothetical protein [Candidatus Paceibacterota bacterium]MDD5357448.1 hypothetical protein [Candidatus Paceibacterota bacterium]
MLVIAPFDTRALSVDRGDPKTKKELGADDFFVFIEAIVRSGQVIKPGAPKVKVVKVGRYKVPINVTLTASLSPQLKKLWNEKVEYAHLEHWSQTVTEAIICSVQAVMVEHLGLTWDPILKRIR